MPILIKYNKQKEIKQIPKNLHYIWFGDKNKIPLQFSNRYVKTWQTNFLQPQWKWYFWDYQLLRQLIIEKQLFQPIKFALSNKNYVMAADLARLVVLYKYGGIYVDIDIQFFKSIIDLLHYDFFVSKQPQWTGRFCSAFIGSKPRNPIFLSIFHKTYQKYKKQANLQVCPQDKFAMDIFTYEIKTLGFISQNQEQSQVIHNSICLSHHACHVDDHNLVLNNINHQKGEIQKLISGYKDNYCIHHWACSYKNLQIDLNKVQKICIGNPINLKQKQKTNIKIIDPVYKYGDQSKMNIQMNIGTAHFNASVAAIQNKNNPVLIFQNDVVVSNYYKEILKYPYDADIIWLGYTTMQFDGFKSPSTRKHDQNFSVICHGQVWGCHAVLLLTEKAKLAWKISSRKAQITGKGIDCIASRFKDFYVLQYCINTPYFFQSSPDKPQRINQTNKCITHD